MSKFVVIQFWDDADDEWIIGEFDTREQAEDAISQDREGWDKHSRGHVRHRIEERVQEEA